MNEEYMKIANDLALENAENNFKDGGPFGAIIVLDNKIIGKGKNSCIVNHDPTAHAEISAIRDACKNLNTHDLTNAVIYTSTYPCPMCLSAIIWANIKTVYYGNTKEDAASIGFRDNDIYEFIKNNKKNVLETKNISRELTIKTFELFDKNTDKIMY